MAQEPLGLWLSPAASRENFVFHSRSRWLSGIQEALVSEAKLERLIIRHWDTEAKLHGGEFKFLLYPPQPLIEPGRFHLAVSSFRYPSILPFSRFPLNPVTGAGDGYSLSKARLVSLVELLERTSFFLMKYGTGFSRALRVTESLSALERECVPPSSTGAAVHRSPAAALSSAILECLERDAYLCHWYTGTRPRPITLPKNAHYHQAQSWFRAQRLSFEVFELRTFIPEAVALLTVAYDPACRDKTTLFATGVACDVGFHEAFERAIFELNRFVGLGLALRNGATRREDPGLNHPMGRFYHYLRPENIDALRTFLPGDEPKRSVVSAPLSRAERRNRLRRLIEALRKATHSEVFAYPTPVPVSLQDFLFGVFVEVPALQKLDYETPPSLNLERLTGFRAQTAPMADPAPHPLP